GRARDLVGEGADHVQERVGVPEFFGLEPAALAFGDAREIDDLEARVGGLLRLEERAEPVHAGVGHARDPRVELRAARVVARGGVIGLWAWTTGRFAGLRMARAEWRPLILLGLLFTLQIGSMNVGTSLTSAAHSAILLNLYAVHTVVLAHFLIPGDRLTLRKLA